MKKSLYLTAFLISLGTLHAAESISINFGAGTSSITDTNTAGLTEQILGSNWNQVSGISGTSVALKDGTGATTASTLTFSCANTWKSNADATDGNSQMLKAYLDDGSGVNISVAGLTYLTYSVYIYCNTDTTGKQYTAKTVNGTSYTYTSGATAVGTTAWGSTNALASLVEGTNTLVVSG